MSGVVFNGTYQNGIVLSNPTVQNPATISSGAYVTNTGTSHSGDAVFGSSGTAWAVDNFGAIVGQETTGAGIYLASGGSVTNGSAGVTGARISGHNTAVSIKNAAGTVTNFATIASTATGTTGVGIYFNAGGTVINQASGVVTAYRNAVSTANVAATVVNFGTIAHLGGGTIGRAIYLGAGGAVTNYGLLSNGAVGNTISGYPGVITSKNGTATVRNLGVITNSNNSNGVNLDGGGTLVNGASGMTSALVTAYHNAVYVGGTLGIPTLGAVGLVANYGTIENSGSFAAVFLVSGGTIANHGLILSPRTAASFENTAGTIDNFGTILSTAPLSGTHGSGAYLGSGGLIINEGGALITAQRAAVSLGGSGTTGAPASVGNFGTLLGSTGVSIGSGDTGNNTIVNFGTIVGTSGIAINLGSGNDLVVIEPGSVLSGAIGHLHPGDAIDLPGLAFAGGGSATVGPGNVLQVSESTGRFSIALDPSQSFLGDRFRLSGDGSGGTLITETLQPNPTNDFDGDGISDVLWQNDNGAVAVWDMSASGVGSSSIVGFADPSWHIRTTGDFDGNGTSDVLWQNDNGAVATWEMSGAGVTASSIVGFADPSWHILASGDFDGNGTSDVLWQNNNGDVATWEMSGAGVSATSIVGFADPSWHVRGTGDFDANGASDVLWQNDNGDVAVWEMAGDSVVSSTIVGFADTSWHIRGTGDFDGNGTSDVLWQNNNGDVAVWEMNGNAVLSSSLVGFADPSWHIRGIGDFDGNGTSDVLWQNDNGDVATWEMDGAGVAATSLVGFADPSWHIIPPDNTGDLTGAPAASFTFNDMTAPSATPSGQTASSTGPAPSSSGGGGMMGADTLFVAPTSPSQHQQSTG